MKVRFKFISLTHVSMAKIITVYAYIPTPNNLCDESNVICNDDFGTSIGRGDFGFPVGQYERLPGYP